VSRSTLRATAALEMSKRLAVRKAPAGHRPVVFGRRFALSAQPHFLSLSSSKKEERAGERRRFSSVSPLSDSLPARSSQGERGKTPQAVCVPNAIGHRPALLWLRLRRAALNVSFLGAPAPALSPRRCNQAWCNARGEGSRVRILLTKASHIKPLNGRAWERRRLAGDFFGLDRAGGDAGAPRFMGRGHANLMQR